MKFTGLSIDGIDILMEHGHYVLHKNGVKMRCDLCELNTCIPEFKRYYKEQFRELKAV